MIDVLVIGGGTMGLYLASALKSVGLSVMVVESDDATAVVGATPQSPNHRGVTDGWRAGWGGTSTRWGGQLWPWEEWETQGGSSRVAWPLAFGSDIEPYYERVVRRLGLPPTHTQLHRGDLGLPRFDELGSDLFEARYSTWISRRQRDFSRNPALAVTLSNVIVRRATTVSRVESRDGHVIAHASSDGDGFAIPASRAVLAAGTLGNARILLDSGVEGDSTPFSDHLSTRVAEVEILDFATFANAFAHRYIAGVRTSVRLANTAKAGARHLPGYIHFESQMRPGGLPDRLARQLRHDGRASPSSDRTLPSTKDALRIGGASMRALSRRQRPLDPTASYYLRVDIEQESPSSNTLSWRPGAAGRQNLQVDWRITEVEQSSLAAHADAAIALLDGRFGLGRIHALPHEPIQDTYHMLGSTPIGTVLDSNLAVKDLPNLYVIGASAFPSGGIANPTFTALALGERLLDYIAR